MTTLTTDPWATLPTDWMTRPLQPMTEPQLEPAPYIAKLPELKLPETTCHPRCRRCHHPEGRGQCRTCVLACDHTTQLPPAKRKPVEICLTRTRATARTAHSPSGTGRQILIVDTCPHCQQPHIHTAHPDASPYRLSACGQTYLLETTP